MKQPTIRQVAKLLLGAELLRKALSEAAHVMMECPHCNNGTGLEVAMKVMNALDMYEPAAASVAATLKGTIPVETVRPN